MLAVLVFPLSASCRHLFNQFWVLTEEVLPKILDWILSGPTSAGSEWSTGAMHVSSSWCMDWRRQRQDPANPSTLVELGVDRQLNLRLQPIDVSNSVVLFLPSFSDLGTFPGNLVRYGARQPTRRRSILIQSSTFQAHHQIASEHESM